MERSSYAISNASPLIHLAQIDCFKAFNVWNRSLIPQEVFDEVCKFEAPGNKEIRESEIIFVRDLDGVSKI